MYLSSFIRADIAAIYAHAERLAVQLRHTRWKAARIRQRARLTRLARNMPQANSLTLTITEEILVQHSLLG